MSLTLRQVQKMFSASCKGGKNITVKPPTRQDTELLGLLGQHLGGNRFRHAVVSGGHLRNVCDCPDCSAAGRVMKTARSTIDRWVRKHGPDADLAGVLRSEAAEQEAQQQQSQSGQGSGQQQQPQAGQQTGGNARNTQQPGNGSSNARSTGQPSNQTASNAESAQTTGPAPKPHPATQPFSEQPTQRAPTPLEQAREMQRAAQEKLAAAKQALQNARKAGKSSEARAKVYAAKRQLRAVRKQASFNKVAMASSPSLSARKRIAQANGRLQRVPQALRSKMADLINRLVMQGGTAGENPSPTPLLSAQKVVKRFLVRRPLSNAFKEDTIIGRPVTVFLPDVSPSCAAQAQIACDLANAAGFAGVSGSDVLVLPHSNGCVQASAEYTPWFNGKPMLSELNQINNLFADICSGNSRFRVKVAVLLGDHDAVERYGEIAALRSVLRVIWLHNWGDDGHSNKPPVMAEDSLLPVWAPDAMKKLTMVAGCGGQRTMLQGFEMALHRKTSRR